MNIEQMKRIASEENAIFREDENYFYFKSGNTEMRLKKEENYSDIDPDKFRKELIEMKNDFELTKESILKNVHNIIENVDYNTITIKKVKNAVIEEGIGKKTQKEFKIKVSSDMWNRDLSDGTMSITITDEILERYEIDKKELEENANKNDREAVQIKSMYETLSDLMGEDLPEEMDTGMYVVSNPDKVYGAGVLFSPPAMYEVVKEVRRRTKCSEDDIYIMPSSIHEFIVVIRPDATMQEVENMVQMVEEVNATQVSPEERVDDAIFKLRVANPSPDGEIYYYRVSKEGQQVIRIAY